MSGDVLDPTLIDPSLDSRAVTFENPTGARGAGGTAHGGRKGAPAREIAAGERVVLMDHAGPGTIRHIWMTFHPGQPAAMRAMVLEVFYDDQAEPSVSAPCLDFFGMPHGRPVAYASALTSAQEGRGFNSYIPMPFDRRVRVEFVNASDHPATLFYQVDFTLEDPRETDPSYLHVAFRRDNPTRQKDDFVIVSGIEGPGRFLGCNVGVRVIDAGTWYGEGEVKIYRDGDVELPTICGTGLEDYVGSAWGLGRHEAPYAGAPLVVGPPVEGLEPGQSGSAVEFVGFYRWHLADPIMFWSDLRVTIQQIGLAFFPKGQEAEFAAYGVSNPVAGAGWLDGGPDIIAWGIAERVDDYCATSYVYARRPQAVPRVDVAAAIADIDRRPYEDAPPPDGMGTTAAPAATEAPAA